MSFGETTGWIAVPVNKTVMISDGSGRLDYKISVINPDGTVSGELQVLDASSKFVNYSDFWNAFIGRRYHHVLSGLRSAVPISAVRQFTAL